MILFRSKLNNSFRIESDFGGKKDKNRKKWKKQRKIKQKKIEIKTSGSENKRKNHIGVNVLCIISINEGKM